MRALVIANGDPPPAALLGELAAHAGLVVAADGGADIALAAGVHVAAVVGDLDSVSFRVIREEGVEVVRDTDPDHTDLEKAVGFCVARGATRIDIAAAGGGRSDHALANLSVLRVFAGADVRIVDEHFETRLVRGHATIDGEPGRVVSLIAIGRCEGVTTQGLRWPLTEALLDFSPQGVHNEIMARPASVSVRTGDLYLFVGRWVERHGEQRDDGDPPAFEKPAREA